MITREQLVAIFEKNENIFGQVRGQTYGSMATVILEGIGDLEAATVMEALDYQITETDVLNFGLPDYDRTKLALVMHPIAYYVLVRSNRLLKYCNRDALGTAIDTLLGVPIFRNHYSLAEGEWLIEDQKRNKRAGGFIGR